MEAEAKFVKNTLRTPRKTLKGEGGHTMIVGHSLGGAYTNIVGPRAHIPTFALSPPGLYYGLKKFGLRETNDLYPYVTSIIPDHDPIPKADFQVGNLQNIPCTANIAGVGSQIQCHSAKRTLATLVMAW